jgi:hypothetical protein
VVGKREWRPGVGVWLGLGICTAQHTRGHGCGSLGARQAARLCVLHCIARHSQQCVGMVAVRCDAGAANRRGGELPASLPPRMPSPHAAQLSAAVRAAAHPPRAPSLLRPGTPLLPGLRCHLAPVPAPAACCCCCRRPRPGRAAGQSAGRVAMPEASAACTG